MGDNGVAFGYHTIPNEPTTVTFDAEILSGDFNITHYYDGSAIQPMPTPHLVVNGANSIDVPLVNNASGWIGLYDEDIDPSEITFRNVAIVSNAELVTFDGEQVIFDGEEVTW